MSKPRLPKNQLRVTITTRVRPETQREIKRRARSARVSLGVLMDQTFPPINYERTTPIRTNEISDAMAVELGDDKIV